MHAHFSRCLVAAAALVWTGSALAVLPQDFVAMRILEPPAVHPPLDCLDYIEGTQPCGAGPARVMGITNAGDMFGVLESNYPHLHHDEDAIRWLRNTGYAGENVQRPQMPPGFRDAAGVLLPGAMGDPTLSGRTKGIHMQWVTSEGFASGVVNTTNTDSMHYDIVNDTWTYLGPGGGMKANNHGLIPVFSWLRIGQGPRVADISLVEKHPLAQENRGTVQTFADNINPMAINDNNVIVGFDNEGTPIRIMPTGPDTWGEPMAMDEIGPAFVPSEAIDLSHTDPAIAIGVSQALDGKHGAVWDTSDGTIIADLGPRTEAWRISGNGKYIVGRRAELSFPPTFEEVIWWSDDAWQTVNEVMMDEILKVVPGGDLWAEITKLTGVNDHGQITGQGLLNDVLASGEEKLLTAWARDLAIGEVCGQGSFFPRDDGCGIPFLLDTMELGPGVIRGDVNNDGIVDFIDITPFINAQSAEGSEEAFLLLTPGGCFLCADINMDGAIDFIDITPYVNLLDQVGAAAVPEPNSLAMLTLCLLAFRRRGHCVGT